METVTTVRDMQQKADSFRCRGKTIALVPTMGSLHEGHLDLLRAARKAADIVAVSIFVNPTQFGQDEDFERYPRNIERDSRMAAGAGCDVLFTPEAEEIYPDGCKTGVTVDGLSKTLEGASRPSHFRGVATVVTKLFHIVKPHTAFFGQKDIQQAVILQRMVKDLNFDIELTIVPTRRDPDGLAMSSRNMYLTGSERIDALAISRSLILAREAFANGVRSGSALLQIMEETLQRSTGLAIDYVAVVHRDTLETLDTVGETDGLIAIAARVGKTRLIDNIFLEL